MLYETNASNARRALTLLRFEGSRIREYYDRIAHKLFFNLPNFFTANIFLYSNYTLCDEKLNYFLDFAITKCSSCNNWFSGMVLPTGAKY